MTLRKIVIRFCNNIRHFSNRAWVGNLKQRVPITSKSSKFKGETQAYVVKFPNSTGARYYCQKIRCQAPLAPVLIQALTNMVHLSPKLIHASMYVIYVHIYLTPSSVSTFFLKKAASMEYIWDSKVERKDFFSSYMISLKHTNPTQ